jgi:predicted NBD/HSP70 family sugar kinase
MQPTDTSGGPILSPKALGDVNRSRILQTLVDHGPLSRAELSRFANVTRATIGNIVGSLIDAGVLEEGDIVPGLVGKPARPVWFSRTGALSAVVSMEEHGLEAALVDATGGIVAQHAEDYASTSEADLRAAVLRSLERVTSQRGDSDLLGIGIAVPAMCLSSGEVAASSILPALQGTWLRDLVATTYDLPVALDTDARAQAMAEKWFGQGRGLRAFAAVRVGEGIGAGVVLNGTVFRADQGIGAEFGHTVVVQHGGLPCKCGRSGCWETVAGTDWLRSEAARRGLPDPESLDCATLVSRTDTAELLADYADNLAVGIANLMHVYHPQLVVLNGDVRNGGEPLRAAVEAAFQQRAVPLVSGDARVVLSELDGLASLQGAAAMVLSSRYQLAV